MYERLVAARDLVEKGPPRRTRALLSLPASDVESTIVANWEQLADPSTTTDDLLTMAGLDPIGPPERVAAIPVVCTWY